MAGICNSIFRICRPYFDSRKGGNRWCEFKSGDGGSDYCGVGYGLGVTSGAITGLGTGLNLVFGGGGIVPAALLAIVLNVLIPKGKDDIAAEEAAAHLEALKAEKMAEKL